ncbi:MAG: hypothetical protein JNM48_14180 [Rhodospirillales bacterium]|nr:hypothetical protein [Rhodospirillales bacterium]
MSTQQQDLPRLHRLLYRHQWTDVADWGRAIAALADLSEPDIDRLLMTGGAAAGQVEPAPATDPEISG